MAKQQKSPQNLLKKVKPKVVQLNKKMVILITGIVLLAVLLVMFNAFRTASERDNQAKTAVIKTQSNLAGPEKNIASSLPSSYQDAKSIHRLLGHNQHESLPTSVKHELEKLRTQQMTLQQQLNRLKSSKTHPAVTQPRQQISPLTNEAISSGIFFSGGTPQPLHKQMDESETREEAGTHLKTASTKSEKSSDYEKQNMQQQKLSFLSDKPDKNIYNTNRFQRPVSKYEIQAGTEIPAILDTEINSDVPGVIVAFVSQDVYDSINGQYLLIPKGSKLIGVYNSKVSYGQSILQAKFTRLVRPDGSSIVLPNQPAINDQGVSGISGKVDNHWGGIIGSAVLSAIFNIPAIIASNQMNTNNNSSCTGTGEGRVCTIHPSLSSLTAASALQGVGQGAAHLGQELTQKSLNIQPTITIGSGYRFSVMVTKDMVLPPYKMPFEKIPNLAGE